MFDYDWSVLKEYWFVYFEKQIKPISLIEFLTENEKQNFNLNFVFKLKTKNEKRSLKVKFHFLFYKKNKWHFGYTDSKDSASNNNKEFYFVLLPQLLLSRATLITLFALRGPQSQSNTVFLWKLGSEIVFCSFQKRWY